jgi:VIT1/CCC1 family predicted Fe2+/Mn2+ transporter
MHGAVGVDAKLGRQLVLDELFDLTLYRSLHRVAAADLRAVLEQLIPIETRHYAFWQEFFGLAITRLDPSRRLKLALLVGVARLFGAPAIHLILEAIEVYGVRKYLAVWRRYEGGPLGQAVRGILEDEFKHEDAVVTAESERQLSPQRVRDIFLGLNDGLVEILGAVSGFFGAFANATTVLVAGMMVGVAGALSMGAGAYLAGSSEAEVRDTEVRRRRFLGQGDDAIEARGDTPLASGVRVGVSYVIGAVVPVLPVLVGARTLLPSLVVAGGVIVVVSTILAFLSGMNVKRRILMNLAIIAAAVAISYVIGLLAQSVWDIRV